MSRLALFDFDATLFRSPHPPASWVEGWWREPESLEPPCLPEKPGAEYWIPQSVAAARQAINDPNTLAVLATGRPLHSGLRYRVPELLKFMGFRFDHVFMNDQSNVAAFKSGVIRNLLHKYDHIDKIEMWDDMGPYLQKYKQVAISEGVPPENVILHLVRAQAKPALCEPSAKNVADRFRSRKQTGAAYLGLFLDSRSRAALAHEYPALHEDIESDHVTLMLKPTTDIIEKYDGASWRVQVIGYAVNDRVEAVAVKHLDSDPELTSLREGIPHVTLSVAPGVKPVEANDLLAHGYEPVPQGLILHGIIGTGPR